VSRRKHKGSRAEPPDFRFSRIPSGMAREKQIDR
jgi:hypothetical protein